MLQRLTRMRNAELGMRNVKRKRGLLPFAIRPGALGLFAISAPLVLLAAGGLPEWLNNTWSYVLLAMGFSLVIFVHELGHFAAAKWAGVRVDQFAVGFGHAVLSYRKGIGMRVGSTARETNRRIDEYLAAQAASFGDDRPSMTRMDPHDQLAAAHPGANDPSEQNDAEEALVTSDPRRVAAARTLGLGETEYRVNWMPLGGYVKMLGQEDFVVDKSGELKVKNDPDSFTNKSIGQRMVIISAGVIMNLIFATVAFAVVVMIGRLQQPPVVGQVVETSAAARAGLQTGDRILSINGAGVDSFNDLSGRIALSEQDEELVLDIVRDGRHVDPPPRVKPEYNEHASVRRIGISPGMNLRVLESTLQTGAATGADTLRKYDQFYKLVDKGVAKEVKDLGVFRRAIVQAQGEPVEIVVKRPTHPDTLNEESLLKNDAGIESTEVPVQLRAIWLPLPYEPDDEVNGNLLGLVPRLTVIYAEPGKSFDRAGVEPDDIITKIGDVDYPSYSALKKIIEENDGAEVPIEVRRPAQANGKWSEAVVRLCTTHREALIAAARTDLKQALELAGRLTESEKLSSADADPLMGELRGLSDKTAWRRWLERVDVHQLKPVVPKSPFALFGKTIPTVDAEMRCVDEDHVVVADVASLIGDRVSSAKDAAIPIGAVILGCNGRGVSRWQDLSKIFRANAGKAVDVMYRVADEVRVAKMNIPACITSTLNIPFGSRIIRIADKDSCMVKRRDKQAVSIALPDWRAVETLLKESVGKTVAVEYVTPEGEKRSGQFSVTPDNTDPWLQRIRYVEPFVCFPLLERHQVTNPIAAAADGFKQAYQATMQTVLSIKHMLFTHQVGLSKVSGPVGIIRLGSKFAGSSALDLLWFLALISANLAVLNFLPLPIVDGGLFLFLILEKLRGEPVSIKTQVATQLIGIALIATVFILVTYQDIKNWITGT